MDCLRIGIIGIGNMGSAHASCVYSGKVEGMKLAAVCDIEEKKLEAFRELHPDVRTYRDYEELLGDGEIDGVIIAVPHPLHAMIAEKALKSGKHVQLEKPADIAVSRVKKLNEIAGRSGKVFSIMFNQRTNPLFAKAREIVKGGELGELKRSVWIVTNWYRTQRYYDSGTWRATWGGEGGGVLLNQAPHNLDLWQWICGMPESLTAYCDVAKYHDIEVEDDATIVTRYPGGAMGTFITTTGEYPGTNRLEISGSRGKIVLEGGVLKWWKLREDERVVCKTSEKNFARIESDYVEIRQEEQETGHQGILQNFANAILKGEELLAPGTDGIYELTLSNAAYLSQWKGSREVQLPFDPAEFDAYYEKLAAGSRYRPQGSGDGLSEGYSTRWKVNW